MWEKMRGENVENFLLEFVLDRVSGTPSFGYLKHVETKKQSVAILCCESKVKHIFQVNTKERSSDCLFSYITNM